LTVDKNDVNGEAVYSFNSRRWQVWRGGGKREVHVSGSFRENRFGQLNYKSKDETAMHFGSILLELRGDGRTLEGKWMGYSSTQRLKNPPAVVSTLVGADYPRTWVETTGNNVARRAPDDRLLDSPD
jgi:hypothetical protein